MSFVFDPLQATLVAVDVASASLARPADIGRRQRERLTRLLAAAAQRSARYRRLLRGMSVAEVVLTDLPVVTRAELMRGFADWVGDPDVTLARLREFIADPARIGTPFLGRYLVWESSGTGGEPGIFVQDAQALAVYDALEALRRSAPRPWQRWLDPLYLAERMAFIGATDGHFASQVSVQRLRRLYPWLAGRLRSFSILQPTAELVAQLNRYAPTVVATYPTVAVLLADEAVRGRLHTRPREVWTGGETLSAAMRRSVQRALGCSVRNSYGASEFMSIAWECEQGAMHVNADWVILEPVDARHRPVPPGTLSHTTLLTNLANRVQPLIRYDLGDQVAVAERPCACGSPLPAITVRGRRDDPLLMQGRDGQPVTLLPLALTTVIEEDAGVFDFQLLQRSATSLALRLNSTGPAAAEAHRRCRQALDAFAARQGLAPLTLLAQTDQPLGHGRSGKVQRVVALACAAGLAG